MTTKLSKAAATLGRIKSPAKATTSRENGKRGGRPTHRYYRVEDANPYRYGEGTGVAPRDGDAPRDRGGCGLAWSGTVLAVRADGTGYLLTDRWEEDRAGLRSFRQYVGGRRRPWPAAAEQAVDATGAVDFSIPDALRRYGEAQTIEMLKKAIDAFFTLR